MENQGVSDKVGGLCPIEPVAELSPPPNPVPPLQARVSLKDAAKVMGVSKLTLLEMTIRGDVPGAAFLLDIATYDIAALKRFARKCGPFPEFTGQPTEFRLGHDQVYVVGYGGFVKIGFTRSGGARMETLQTASPQPLTVYAVLSGGMDLERFLHQKFKVARFKGEWFRKVGTLRKWIKEGCPTPYYRG